MSHWYFQNGTPCHSVPKADGTGDRPTTLRDARKLNLFPSVTTIGKVVAAPGLVEWIVDQALISAVTLPRLPGESLDEYLLRAKLDSQQQVRDAADEGHRVHDALNRSFDDPDRVPSKYDPHCRAVHEYLTQRFGGETIWRSEIRTVCRLGYAGSMDLCRKEAGFRHALGDFKTKDLDLSCADKRPGQRAKQLAFDEHIMQLGGYGQSEELVDPEVFNIFVSTKVPGQIRVVDWTPDEYQHGVEMFNAALKLWQVKNKYAPEWK